MPAYRDGAMCSLVSRHARRRPLPPQTLSEYFLHRSQTQDVTRIDSENLAFAYYYYNRHVQLVLGMCQYDKVHLWG